MNKFINNDKQQLKSDLKLHTTIITLGCRAYIINKKIDIKKQIKTTFKNKQTYHMQMLQVIRLHGKHSL